MMSSVLTPHPHDMRIYLALHANCPGLILLSVTGFEQPATRSIRFRKLPSCKWTGVIGHRAV